MTFFCRICGIRHNTNHSHQTVKKWLLDNLPEAMLNLMQPWLIKNPIPPKIKQIDYVCEEVVKAFQYSIDNGEWVVRLASSLPNSGKGLWALEAIPAGSFVTKYGGAIISRLGNMSDLNQSHFLALPGGVWLVDGTWNHGGKCTGMGQYINSAVDSSVKLTKHGGIPVTNDPQSVEKYRPYFLASQDINAGQEIFWNYRVRDGLRKKAPNPLIIHHK